MNVHFTEYGDEENYISGFLKLSCKDEKTALLEADRNGLISLSRFIVQEILSGELTRRMEYEHDAETGELCVKTSYVAYRWHHFSYLPQVGERDLAEGSYDLYVETFEESESFVKEGKTYRQYGYALQVDIDNLESADGSYLMEPDAELCISCLGTPLIGISGNRKGLHSFCKFLLMLAYGEESCICLHVENKEKWGELIDQEGAVSLNIVKRME